MARFTVDCWASIVSLSVFFLIFYQKQPRGILQRNRAVHKPRQVKPFCRVYAGRHQQRNQGSR